MQSDRHPNRLSNVSQTPHRQPQVASIDRHTYNAIWPRFMNSQSLKSTLRKRSSPPCTLRPGHEATPRPPSATRYPDRRPIQTTRSALRHGRSSRRALHYRCSSWAEDASLPLCLASLDHATSRTGRKKCVFVLRAACGSGTAAAVCATDGYAAGRPSLLHCGTDCACVGLIHAPLLRIRSGRALHGVDDVLYVLDIIERGWANCVCPDLTKGGRVRVGGVASRRSGRSVGFLGKKACLKPARLWHLQVH
jgi:hypothetical protein